MCRLIIIGLEEENGMYVLSYIRVKVKYIVNDRLLIV